ncbi:MAG: amidase family protein [Gammaproteobacteria bacterium]|nr:amidase family protein [Gammaproteobacteria bacterium]
MSKHELCYLSGVEALSKFGRGLLSPVELVEAIVHRSEALQPQINAFTDQYFDQAMDQAKLAEKRYRKGHARKLEGLPIVVKDEFRLSGTRRTSCSIVFQDRVDDETDVIIDRLLREGAIVIAKTTAPEFCLLGSCHSKLFGVTRNPWDLRLAPGGSSGGTGAALAAGMTTLGTGTDIGGSIRIPAAQCGVVGYKPPYGRNPEVPVFNLDFYSHSGPMTRSVFDIALMQNVISGPHNQDIATLRSRVKLSVSDTLSDLKGWKIAWSMNFGFMEIDREVEQNTLDALRLFNDLGATVEQVDLGWTEQIIQAAHSYWSHNWAVNISHLLNTQREKLTDYAIYFLERASKSKAQDYLRSLQTTVDMYRNFGPLMDQYDLFICPTLATNQIPAEYTWPDSEVTINDQSVISYEENWSLTYPFNMLSRCPVLALPSGFAGNGVPTGIQIVSRTFDDQKVIEAGKVFEANTDFLNQWKLDPKLPIN